MSSNNPISDLLHRLFGLDAIQAGALCEQLDDAEYCTVHKMNYGNGGKERQKWEELRNKAKKLASGDQTFSVENMRNFQAAVNDLIRENPGIGLYTGLSETESYAVRRFYYFNCH